MLANLRQHQPDKLGGRRGQFRMIRKALGLDVEQELALGRESEDLIERRHARARHGLLPGKRRILHFAAVPLANLGQRQRVDHRLAGRVRCTPEGAAGIVRDHQDVVLGDRHVELQRVHALRDRVFERRQSVLRTKRARAAMAVNQYLAGTLCAIHNIACQINTANRILPPE